MNPDPLDRLLRQRLRSSAPGQDLHIMPHFYKLDCQAFRLQFRASNNSRPEVMDDHQPA